MLLSDWRAWYGRSRAAVESYLISRTTAEDLKEVYSA